ncbi:unnamed protein product [Spirodela intermedia]|uniref:F-box domain-containing protein n=1 Tax=Spirodela intermedia TaxID=51605 RepID=A0A7I8KZ22_SPIIN|nr:unnamed protein product [Spirodela intermedia]
MDPLIPGLPDDVARACLTRVPYPGFRAVRSVCKQWREELESPAFHEVRRGGGLNRTLVALAQSEQPSSAASVSPLHKNHHRASSGTMPYRMALFEPDSGTWDDLPTAPDHLPHGLPLFCQVAATGRTLVVLGGWDPSSWAASDEVFIYDFLSGDWRRGAPMPGPRRSFFACASDSHRTVYVAGGHDDEKNALRSAMAYDVERDEWAPLPDMAKERDECKGVFRGGAFLVVGGYSTETQGQFGKCSEAFDAAARRWSPVDEDALATGLCPRTCVAGDEGLYRCTSSHVEFRGDSGESTWLPVAELPEEVRLAPCAVALPGGRLMVVGSACHGGPHSCYILEPADGKRPRPWRRAAVPEEYSGHVQASCCLQI